MFGLILCDGTKPWLFDPPSSRVSLNRIRFETGRTSNDKHEHTHIPTHPHSTVGLNKQRRRWLGCYRCCRLSRVTLFSPSGGQQRVPTEGRTCGIDDTFPDSCACCISLHLCVLPSWSTYIGRALLLRLPDTVIKTYDTCKLLQP